MCPLNKGHVSFLSLQGTNSGEGWGHTEEGESNSIQMPDTRSYSQTSPLLFKKKKLSVDLFLAVLGVTFSTLDPQSQLWHVNSVAAGMWDLVP